MKFVFLSFCLIIIAFPAFVICKKNRVRAIITAISVLLSSVLMAIPAIMVLMGDSYEYIMPTNLFFGNLRFTMDALSAWFVLIIGIVFSTGAFYGMDYMKHYLEHKNEITLHCISYIMAFASMMALCLIRHSLLFLVTWEIMALSSFLLIIFESWKPETMKAGLNFFIQSHISVVLLTIGFLLMEQRTGSYDFNSIVQYSQTHNCNVPFILLFLGFAVKAGFVPFHTWLPHAHPAAPAHISGVMSGVIIKIGIYGILRMLTVFTLDYLSIGYFILTISAISGLYGVMLAIVQHNLKKLLAYHSIENIGIIGMGIGIGCIGLGVENNMLAALGFGGALLHTLNHALFKSTLFYAAGNIYQATHTLNIEKLGGLIKKMPYTALFFLVASVSICGLPPMNGFVSEFLIYLGLFNWMEFSTLNGVIGAVFAILALVMIGGLAILCFTKAFGIVFLGSSRSEAPLHAADFGYLRNVPLTLVCVMMLSIGLFPKFFVSLISGILPLFGVSKVALTIVPLISSVGRVALLFVAVVLFMFMIRRFVTRKRQSISGETWGCGYTAATPKIQYTATSFVKTYANLFAGLLGFESRKDSLTAIFPQSGVVKSENYDKFERNCIEKPLSAYQRLMNYFSFLQNGKLQFYILYGILFIIFAIVLTVIWS